MIIDFHTHFYTQAYLNELERGSARAQLVRAQDGTQRIQLDGDYSLIDPAHVQVAPILAVMAQHQVTHQLLTFSIPGLQVEEPAQGVRLAQLVNDEFAAVVQQHPTQLSALAALPLQDPTAATMELDRAVTQLGLRGGQLFSNINGNTLDDKVFWPLYARAAELDVPLFIHPISPPYIENMRNYRMAPMMGFMFDTALAAAHLVFSGVMQSFPKLKIVLGNLGGAIPYLAGRMDRAFAAYPESQGVLAQAPSVYLKRMYYESAGMPDAGALQLALDFAGVDQMMFGSDFPQQIGDVPSSIALIQSLPLAPDAKAKVLGGNAAKLLHLP
ncbi:MAG: amidohydrolase family protein [Caldilineaceae bacterium]